MTKIPSHFGIRPLLTRRTMIAGLASALAVSGVVQIAEARADAAQNIADHFSSVKSMAGEFVQFGPRGEQTGGKFFIERPGKIRFNYESPSNFRVVADGKSVVIENPKLKTSELYSLSQTPLKLLLDDVRINPTAESAGTLGSLDADVTWSAQGIKDTVQGIIPVLGNLVSGVTPDPSTGTLELEGPLGTVTILPQVADGGLSLQVVKVTGLGFTLPRETVQPALDAFTSTLTANLPMGIHADSVSVTDTGVSAKFITRDATIPNGAQDPCFAGI